MKLKNIYFVLALIGFSLMACEKEYVAPLADPNHVSIVSSQMNFDNTIQVNGQLTLGDVSPGVVSRTWTFPAGVVDILDAADDTQSSADVVRAVFTKPGVYPVMLHQEFAGTAWVGNQQRGSSFDTTIQVTVLDSVRIALQAYYVNADGSQGEALRMQNGAKNEVIASKSVRFVYTVAGQPQEFLWELEGGDPARLETNQTEVDVKYKRIGTYDVRFAAWRDRPLGDRKSVV